MLHHANAIVLNNRVAYNGDTVMISLKDLQCLVAGAALLDTKATNVYTTLVNKLPAHARRQYQLEEWYQDTVNVSNAAKASQQVQKVVTRKNGIGSGRLGMQPGAAIPPPSAPKQPYIMINGHVAQPVFPAIPSSQANLPLCETTNLQTAPKHTLLRSPGQSPVKKKAKGTEVGPALRPLRPKMSLNEYMIWASVERTRLGVEDPIHDSKSLTTPCFD
ncbi:hypothetical protein BU26DRAFT_268468 [Trematosphaeria pertusa]|uniref:Uncharacterized protein n=1 Tax=Trematosphaeria pertusa TaxID=390896 RepID=A0A6A6IKE6_9PLEO|nr:uncharacterized protein BU26DRAFT_268468 [Trematosphaeria pertusa]KAF2250679.1 hypothetical protein BU26DRAFT_268468 [Trematosphaeria pertusa]